MQLECGRMCFYTEDSVGRTGNTLLHAEKKVISFETQIDLYIKEPRAFEIYQRPRASQLSKTLKNAPGSIIYIRNKITCQIAFVLRYKQLFWEFDTEFYSKSSPRIEVDTRIVWLEESSLKASNSCFIDIFDVAL